MFEFIKNSNPIKAKKKLKIGVLSVAPKIYSTNRLIDAGRARGHDMHIVDTLGCSMNISSHHPSVVYKGEALEGFDAIIPRIGASITFYGTAVLRQFEMMGVHSVNRSIAISRSRDKLRALQLLSRDGIGMPETWFAHNPDDLPHIMEQMQQEQFVVKLLEGTHGNGVFLMDDRKTAISMIEAFMDLKVNLMVQEFVKEANCEDIRCFVVGDKVIAGMKRKAKDGDFRSNLHRGGSAGTVELSKEEIQTAIKATKALGLNVAGVDMLRSKNGPVILEVNSSPGLNGIEKTTGIDTATPIIEFIETMVK